MKDSENSSLAKYSPKRHSLLVSEADRLVFNDISKNYYTNIRPTEPVMKASSTGLIANSASLNLQRNIDKTFFVPESNSEVFLMKIKNNKVKMKKHLKELGLHNKEFYKSRARDLYNEQCESDTERYQHLYNNSPEKGGILITEQLYRRNNSDSALSPIPAKRKQNLNHISSMADPRGKSVREFIDKTRKIVELKYSYKLKQERETRMKEYLLNCQEATQSTINAIRISWFRFEREFFEKFDLYVKSMNHIKKKEINYLNSLTEKKANLDTQLKILESKVVKQRERLNQYKEFKKFIICVKENIRDFPKDIESDNYPTIPGNSIFTQPVSNRSRAVKKTVKTIGDYVKGMGTMTSIKSNKKLITITIDENNPYKETPSSKNTLPSIKDHKINYSYLNTAPQTSNKESIQQGLVISKFKKAINLYFYSEVIFHQPEDLLTELKVLEQTCIELVNNFSEDRRVLSRINKELVQLKNDYGQDIKGSNNEISVLKSKICHLREKNKRLVETKALQSQNIQQLNTKGKKASNTFNFMNLYNSKAKPDLAQKIRNMYASLSEFVSLYNLRNSDIEDLEIRFYFPEKDLNCKPEDELIILFGRIEKVALYLFDNYLKYINDKQSSSDKVNHIVKAILDNKKRDKILQEIEDKHVRNEKINKNIIEKSNKIYIKAKRKVEGRLRPQDNLKSEITEHIKPKVESKDCNFMSLIQYKTSD